MVKPNSLPACNILVDRLLNLHIFQVVLEHPEKVEELAREFVDAGSDITQAFVVKINNHIHMTCCHPTLTPNLFLYESIDYRLSCIHGKSPIFTQYFCSQILELRFLLLVS